MADGGPGLLAGAKGHLCPTANTSPGHHVGQGHSGTPDIRTRGRSWRPDGTVRGCRQQRGGWGGRGSRAAAWGSPPWHGTCHPAIDGLGATSAPAGSAYGCAGSGRKRVERDPRRAPCALPREPQRVSPLASSSSSSSPSSSSAPAQTHWVPAGVWDGHCTAVPTALPSPLHCRPCARCGQQPVPVTFCHRWPRDPPVPLLPKTTPRPPVPVPHSRGKAARHQTSPLLAHFILHKYRIFTGREKWNVRLRCRCGAASTRAPTGRSAAPLQPGGHPRDGGGGTHKGLGSSRVPRQHRAGPRGVPHTFGKGGLWAMPGLAPTQEPPVTAVGHPVPLLPRQRARKRAGTPGKEGRGGGSSTPGCSPHPHPVLLRDGCSGDGGAPRRDEGAQGGGGGGCTQGYVEPARPHARAEGQPGMGGRGGPGTLAGRCRAVTGATHPRPAGPRG